MDIHTLKIMNNSIEVIFHIPTPSGNNSVGIPYSDCIIHDGEYCKKYKTYHLGDNKDISEGKIVCHYELYHFSTPGLTGEEKQQELEDRFAAIGTALRAEIISKYAYYGHQMGV
jgi:hypothetical protein